jgi:hypothetical protein
MSVCLSDYVLDYQIMCWKKINNFKNISLNSRLNIFYHTNITVDKTKQTAV